MRESHGGWLSLRLTRRGDCLAIEYALDGASWRLHRLAYLPPDLPAMVGPMAVSPGGAGFEVRYRGWNLRAI